MIKIISISGLDGSGKSTQLQLLKDYFREKGIKAYYFHAIDFSIAQKIRRLVYGRKQKNVISKSIISATKNQIRLRKIAFLIDAFRFKFFLKKLDRQGFDLVVSDRFFYDSIINITYLLHKNFPPEIEKYMPRADVAFYLQIDPEMIMKRKRIPDQGLAYLKSKKVLYDMYTSLWNFIVIDGSKSQEEVFKKILEGIKNIL